MRRNCNLELQLHHRSDETQNQEQEQKDQQQLTIFYNGMMCVRDVTELQARTIIFLANKEMQERVKSPLTPNNYGSEPSTPSMTSPLCSPTVSGMSMKRSLQRFLQKRKHRVQATSPYHHH